MLVAYRPELENPPRDGGFGVIVEDGLIQLAPGLNKDVPEQKWSQAKQNPTVKKMMQIGALEEVKDQDTVPEVPEDLNVLSNLPLQDALRTIELIHDPQLLLDWKHREGRVRVRNAIIKRREAINSGNA